MVTLTDKAAEEIKTIIRRREEAARQKGEEIRPVHLRVAVKGGGCSGISYVLDFTDTIGELDKQWEQQGVRVICDPKSLLYLDGTTVDFKDELMGRGFVFHNPNATGTCSCGQSFSA